MQAGDHVRILEAVRELPFNVGKNTVVDVVVGAVTKKMVANTTYMDLAAYGSLEGSSRAEVERWVDKLEMNGMLRYTSPPGKPYWKLLELTGKGMTEIHDPSLTDAGVTASFVADGVDEQSAHLIKEFDFFLEPFTKEQQHAIVCPEKKVLCVAGAGSGKTTVLTKRAEFLVKYRGVQAKHVLAITFTRKAAAEMRKRLSGVPIDIMTFNGLCERILSRAGHKKPIVSFGQKRRILAEALDEHGLTLHGLIHDYFSPGQRRGASQDELARRLLGDVFSILDHFSNEDSSVPDTGRTSLATTLLGVAQTCQEKMDARGVRDYSGQLSEALALLREDSEAIPRYAHVLVDEYQDVNPAQVELLRIMKPQHLFVVGDPRQSIFGWRGSKVEFITRFPADVTVQLTTNYRSQQGIIDLMNSVISRMGLPDLTGARQGDATVQELSFRSEDEERKTLATLLAGMRGQDVFVLARTNAQLAELSGLLRRQNVPHTRKEDDGEQEASGIVLSTVHSIKGLEADTVVVMGCTSRYFPCKVSDHPVIDLIKDDFLDREAEELRLLYVAISRARDTLIISHSNSKTYFLDAGMPDTAQKRISSGRDDGMYEKLRTWRNGLAKKRGLPAYTILQDKTLRELTEIKPKNLLEMHAVHGMGPAKIEQFGEDLLSLLE